jgi:hypothetical protein
VTEKTEGAVCNITGREILRRLTRLNAEKKYLLEYSDLQEAINRLARFENLCEELVEESKSLPAELERLKGEGKEKTVSYRELMAKKLLNKSVLNALKKHGIDVFLNEAPPEKLVEEVEKSGA